MEIVPYRGQLFVRQFCGVFTAQYGTVRHFVDLRARKGWCAIVNNIVIDNNCLTRQVHLIA